MADMSDLAVAGGIGQGLMSFADSYQKAKQFQATNAINQQYADAASQKEQAGLLGQGMQASPGGTVSYTPEMQQHINTQRGLMASQDQIAQDEADPTSDASVAYTKQLKARAAAVGAPYAAAIPEGKSVQWLKSEIEPHLMQEETLANNKSIAQLKANAQITAAGVRNTATNDRTGERVHNNAITQITKDPTLSSLQNSYNSLQVAKSNFDAEGRTPQSFAELQQALRSNMGISNKSGVAERAGSYMRSAGLSEADMQQAFFGDPVDVMKRSPQLVDAIVNTVNSEMKNKQSQGLAQINTLSQAHQAFYNKPGNEDRAEDFQNVVNGKKQQLGITNQSQQQPQGLMGGNQSPPQQFTPDVINYAQTHNITPAQANAIKQQRTAQ